MPTISVGRDRLLAALGRTYTQEEFEDLCFRFGIELDDVTTERAIIRKEKHLEEEADDDEEVIYKIEVPANRYDLLCLEGLAQALCVFNGMEQIPNFTVANISWGSMIKMHVKKETSMIRPFIVCAVLRGITFDEASYNSFIDLQDKLHQNICRRRTLVAIGTHDLDKLEGPFTYEPLPPSEINFVPLKQVKNFRADELMEFYKSDSKLKKFLHIIENSPVFPVIYDCNRTVLSLPPIINGAHSAITLKTKNVFIECTATDLTKAKIVLNTMVTTFSAYCERKYEVQPVEVKYCDGNSYVYPDLSVYNMEVPLSYITDSIGVSLDAQEVTSLLNQMQLQAKQSGSGENCSINVLVPPTRSDVLHACDVMEDVAIAYGYNNIPKRKPSSLKPLPLNQLTDLIRHEIAMNGFTEVVTLILCSKRENFEMLNRKDDKSTAVIIGNPWSSDFEVCMLYSCVLNSIALHLFSLQRFCASTLDKYNMLISVRLNQHGDVLKCSIYFSYSPCHDIFRVVQLLLYSTISLPILGSIHSNTFAHVVRTSLMPGMLKTVGHNKDHPKPIKIFEVGDVVLLDENKDVGASNCRLLGALYCGANSGFELIHGLLDRVMEIMGSPFVPVGDNKGYFIQCSEQPEFLAGRRASIIYKGRPIGTFGIVHPEVLNNFDIPDPCSFLELNIESFL
ncbi:hypothetical protein SLA2020_499430 [Shorea laevis]